VWQGLVPSKQLKLAPKWEDFSRAFGEVAQLKTAKTIFLPTLIL
jgi:hypothetical protein